MNKLVPVSRSYPRISLFAYGLEAYLFQSERSKYCWFTPLFSRLQNVGLSGRRPGVLLIMIRVVRCAGASARLRYGGSSGADWVRMESRGAHGGLG
jgi:hypothetical protein